MWLQVNFEGAIFAGRMRSAKTSKFKRLENKALYGNCELDDAVAEDFIEKNKAANIVRKTESDLNVWYRWCAGVNESRKLEELTPSEL